MCSIALHLRELHKSFNFSSDLLNRVFIQLPYFRVSFPYEPICTVQFNEPVDDLTAGIADDTHQFRLMVSLLLRSTPELINLNQPLPIDFQLFFSEIFTLNLNSKIFEKVKEFSYYVLFHPITYNFRDRIDFIHTIVSYRDLDSNRFDGNYSLQNPLYGLGNWINKYPRFHFLHDMMNHAVSASRERRQANCIPIFIRSAYHYLREEIGKVLILNFVSDFFFLSNQSTVSYINMLIYLCT
jgi:hypothetical protein